jgi:hypothetical protein
MFVDSAVRFDTCIGNSAVKITHALMAKLVKAALSKGVLCSQFDSESGYQVNASVA